MARLWYAVMQNDRDRNYGIGSYDYEIARKAVLMVRRLGDVEAYIAVVDRDKNKLIDEIYCLD